VKQHGCNSEKRWKIHVFQQYIMNTNPNERETWGIYESHLFVAPAWHLSSFNLYW